MFETIFVLLVITISILYYFLIVKPVQNEKSKHSSMEVPAKFTGFHEDECNQFGNEFFSPIIGEGEE